VEARHGIAGTRHIKDIAGKRVFPLSEDKIGYIRISGFGEKTADDLENALKKLEAQGMESLILDLRDNPGGLLDQAIKVCEKFLPRGQLVVSTEGRNAFMPWAFSFFNAASRSPLVFSPNCTSLT
jgi:carboxyl-terminal processing protease